MEIFVMDMKQYFDGIGMGNNAIKILDIIGISHIDMTQLVL